MIVRPASTVAVLRAGEVLMTHRPSSMAFGPGLHVFPGGAVDPDDEPGGALAARSALDGPGCAAAWAGDLAPGEALAHAVAAVRELYEEAGVLVARHRDGSPVDPRSVAAAVRAAEPLDALAARLDLVLATDALSPLSRWVTPPETGVSRRFDARFYVADLPDGAEVAVDAREVVAHAWLAPADGLARFAAGEIELWPPTSATLWQLGDAPSTAAVRGRLRPLGPAPTPEAVRVDEALAVVRLGSGGGVPGVVVEARVVGRRRVVVVDPGDPTDAALDALLAAAGADGRGLAGVVVTSAAPDRCAGAVGLALVAGVPLLASPGAAPLVGEPCLAAGDGELVTLGDVPLRVRWLAGAPDGALRLEPAGT